MASSDYNGCTQENLSLSVTGNNQVSASSGASYDLNGDILTTDGGANTSYTWWGDGHLGEYLNNGAGVSDGYIYSWAGNRIYKSVSSTSYTLSYFGMGSEELLRTDSSGNTTDEFIFFGGARVAHISEPSGTVYYYAADMLGSSRAVVQSGQTSACYEADFYPFGGERPVTNTCGQDFKFEGKQRDSESGLDDFGARYYSSAWGRFASSDWSAVPVPVPYANLTNPQTLNLYAMVSDNPETFADLDGHIGTGSASPGEVDNSCGGHSCPPPPEDQGAINDAAFGLADAYEGPAEATADELAENQAQRQQAPQPDTTESTAQQQVDNQRVGDTTAGALEKTMSNEDRSLSGGAPGELEKGKTALANAIINNAELPNPAKVAQATGTATGQDAQIMRTAVTGRANGGADPVRGRSQYGTSHQGDLKSRSASNHLRGKAGRETVFARFGPFRDSTSRRPTYIYIYNDPGH